MSNVLLIPETAAQVLIISEAGSGGGDSAVTSVNGQLGAVVLNADDIDDTSTTSKFTNAAGLAKIVAAITQLLDDLMPTLGGDLDANLYTIYDFRNNVIEKTGTTETAEDDDTGNVIVYNNASPITVTLPNDLPQGWVITAVQGGAGQVTFSPASGATLRNPSSHTKIAGQYAMATLVVMSNDDDVSAEYVMGGNTE